ncbi:GNAT family N-acetyltransferase [uncultured Erythrobacter sp.]|uniref:GNAT family N-acetyltransferase n=1 Tax=uncultured Erythrobacter sp. TaxID=263913 RepID=UPI002631EF41|nr:GNAT family N-acetyltransferase [uncultured Erythrobacter sp.]
MSTLAHPVDQIMHVMKAAFDPAYGEAWNRKQVSDALVLPSTHQLVINASGQVIAANSVEEAAGFVLTRHAADEEELLLIAVLPDHRGKGLGATMVNHLFKEARRRGTTRIFLEMRRGNPAVHLYLKLGFEPIGERPKYYRLETGERVDAITFGCLI